MLTLGDLHIGQDAIIRVVGGEGELRHHLLDMGLTPGTEVTLRKTAPMGDPIEVELRGYELTLRLADAQKIEIDSVHATDRAAPSEERHKVVAHPGVGELDKAASYHERKAGAPIAAGAPLTFALAGNQNCGKTTLFNQLLTASFSYSDDSRSMAFKDEVVQDGSGTNYKVRMGLLNVDDRLVKITARLVVPISGRFQIMDQGTHPVESSTFEFMRLTLPNDTKTYHELLNAIHSLPLQQIVDVTSQLAGKKIW